MTLNDPDARVSAHSSQRIAGNTPMASAGAGFAGFDWNEFLTVQALPTSYRATAERWYGPLIADIVQRAQARNEPLMVGINGSQGSGKSTLGSLMSAALQRCGGLSVVTLSLDDFYLTHQQRQYLARTAHPLLATRGVPGTHDCALMLEVLGRLQRKQSVALPRFDKAIDDRTDAAQWHQIGAPVDVLIFEGWCLGVSPQSEELLRSPVNALEANEDAGGLWRHYANDALAGDYQSVFGMVDMWVMLAAPNFDCVWRWRCEQEQKLASRLVEVDETDAHPGLMSPEEIARFVQLYQRLTEWGLATLPERVDYLYRLDAERSVVALTHPREGSGV